MEYIEIKGKVNTAICYAKVVEEEAIEQIRRMCDYPMTEGSKIRIMPDVHSGKGCTIGTTMTVVDKVVEVLQRAHDGTHIEGVHRQDPFAQPLRARLTHDSHILQLYRVFHLTTARFLRMHNTAGHQPA